ncbi:MAG: Membrane-associated zinc metalloprotease [uncultured Cytophagales bacterium]|uniref:Zinc metalloprotease n=1 Tax=uncultured Cytophagales bacterium TaxID=158755 RepID=A0A6J4LEA3_9SPHI|nr:MAG: Membrane-associated zinc metalloprotease [uncultured Cytophagales bacterium]
MDVLVMAGQLILGLSILVGLHELGHLLTAKLFGMRVEQYSIGFPPKIFGFKMGETEYSLGAVPLGGYVKITGMIDESLDTEYLGREPQPYEFRAKPAWQRLIVMMGGIIVNVITGIVIFVILLYMFGRDYLPSNQAQHGIVAHSYAQQIGLRTFDRIIRINGEPYDSFHDVMGKEVLLGRDNYYTVVRGNDTVTVDIPNSLIGVINKNKNRYIDPYPATPFTVGNVQQPEVSPGAFHAFLRKIGLEAQPDTVPAYFADIKPGDRILSVNGQPVKFYHEFQAMINKSVNQTVTLQIERPDSVNGALAGMQTVATRVKVKPFPGEKKSKDRPRGYIGIVPKLPLKWEHVDYTFGMAMQEGPSTAFGVVVDNVRAFGKIFRREVSASESLSGPIGIAQIYGSTWDWERFWSLTALLSMILAFMNFLPIPALDGGHVMFLTYEIVSGRSPSTRFLEVAQKVGMVILLSLMVFAFFNDIFKNFFS